MLGNKKAGIGVSGVTTLISRDTVIVGDVHFSGNLDVEGLVQGNIIARPDADACVRVVDKGRVEGDISAPRIVVNGSIEGDVHSSANLELASRARIQGNVFYTLLEMAAGSEVNGSLQHVEKSSDEKGEQKKPDLSVEITEAVTPPVLEQVSAKQAKS